MAKQYILGLDLGTANIGVCILKDMCLYRHLTISYNDIFNVKKSKTNCSIRRDSRLARRQYDHTRRRKVRLLTFLGVHGYIPVADKDSFKTSMKLWRSRQICPEYIIGTVTSVEPYSVRTRLISERLDMTLPENRLMFAQAMYSLMNNRGFAEKHGLTMEDDTVDDEDNESGKIRKSISRLDEQMKNSGARTVGEYLYKMTSTGQRVRGSLYSSRKKHVIREFNMICDVQGLSMKQRKELFDIIFGEHVSSRKPVRARCPYEKNANVTFVSHPAFEEYRMWQLIRNIRILDAGDPERSLTEDEARKVSEIIMSHKNDFEFHIIMDRLGFSKCNFKEDTNVCALKFTKTVSDIIGCKPERLGEVLSGLLGKSADDALDEVWHVCFEAVRKDTDVELFFSRKLKCEGVSIDDISVRDDTVRLSSRACRKITGWMRDKGLSYSCAVAMVGVRDMLNRHIKANVAPEVLDAMEDKVCDALRSYHSKTCPVSMYEYMLNVIEKMALDSYPTINEMAKCLWHSSAVENYTSDYDENLGVRLLPVPHEQFSNPHIDKAMSIMRRVVNMLIKNKVIVPEETSVVMECSRYDNDIIGRIAFDKYNKERKKEHDDAKSAIKKLDIKEPSEQQIEKYILWKEQGGISIWTGKDIPLESLLTVDYDIDHTVAVAKNGCNELYNKTVLEHGYNIKVKSDKLPGNMTCIDVVRERVDNIYSSKARELKDEIKKHSKIIKACADPEINNYHRVERRICMIKLDYYRNKIASFETVVAPDGFCATHGSTNDLLVRCMRSWMKCVFKDVSFIRAKDVAEARNMWGLDKDRSKKSNHVQDAFVLCCLKMCRKTNRLPYAQFGDDLKLVNSSLTWMVPDKPAEKLMKKKDGCGYGNALSKETQYSVGYDRDKKAFVKIRKNVDDSDFKKSIPYIVDRKIKDLFMEAKDCTKVKDSNGNIIRHVRVKEPRIKIDKIVAYDRMNSISKKEVNNKRYFETNGNAYAGYYEDGTVIIMSIDAIANGKRLEKELVDETRNIVRLKYIIRRGDTVILMKKGETEEQVRKLPVDELAMRIFVVKQINSDGRIGYLRQDLSSIPEKISDKGNKIKDISNIKDLGKPEAKYFLTSKKSLRMIKDNGIIMKLVFGH